MTNSSPPQLDSSLDRGGPLFLVDIGHHCDRLANLELHDTGATRPVFPSTGVCPDLRTPDPNLLQGHERSARQDLAGARKRGHPGTNMHRNSGEIVTDELAFAGMNATADFRPRGRTASLSAPAQRIARAGPSNAARNPSPAVLISRPL